MLAVLFVGRDDLPLAAMAHKMEGGIQDALVISFTAPRPMKIFGQRVRLTGEGIFELSPHERHFLTSVSEGSRPSCPIRCPSRRSLILHPPRLLPSWSRYLAAAADGLQVIRLQGKT